MKRKMTREQAKALVALLDSDAELQALLSGGSQAGIGESFVACGGKYRLGSGSIPAPTPTTFVRLSLVECPLLGETGDMTEADIFRALYVWCHGAEACSCVLGLDQRRRALERSRPIAEANPALFAAWLAQADMVERDAWADLDAASAEFAATFGPVTPATMLSVMVGALQDATEAADKIPKEVGKATENPTMRIGWRGIARLLARCSAWALRKWRRCLWPGVRTV